MKMQRLLQPNEEFQEEIKKYKPIDALLAAALFCIICALYGILAFLENKYPVIKEKSFIIGSGVNSLMIVFTILLLKIRKEGLSTIGIMGGKWRLSFLIGFLLAAILFYNNCLSHILAGKNFIDIKEIFRFTLYYLTVSLCEEIVFRGYIGTRMYGLLRNQYLVIVVSGILFVVMHFPYRMIAYGMTISDLTINNVGWILDLFITHTVFSFIYIKTKSLYGSIIAHWMSNLAYNLVIR